MSFFFFSGKENDFIFLRKKIRINLLTSQKKKKKIINLVKKLKMRDWTLTYRMGLVFFLCVLFDKFSQKKQYQSYKLNKNAIDDESRVSDTTMTT